MVCSWKVLLFIIILITITSYQTIFVNGQLSIPSNQPISPTPIVIPNWLKNTAKWWSENQIKDTDFVNGVQYLIQQKIMKIGMQSTTPFQPMPPNQTIILPPWIKNNAGMWAKGQISDSDFIKGIQYLFAPNILA